jgi:uncharacterized protein (TIGR01777 family)
VAKGCCCDSGLSIPIRRTRRPSVHRKVSPSETRLTLQADPGWAICCWAVQLGGTTARARMSGTGIGRTSIVLANVRRLAMASSPGSSGLHLVVSGASGLIGSALVPRLTAEGHRVRRLVRRAPGQNEIAWDPARGKLDAEHLVGVDGVIHLAGENVGVRWTRRRKARIRESRVRGTRLLSETLARLERPPRVLVSASAIGIYGNRGNDLLTDSTPPGDADRDFLVAVCLDWEAAAEPARAARIRVVHPRFGIVLSPRGGALQRLLLPFRLGLGGHLGDGSQWMSWITIDDVVSLICHVLFAEQLHGPVNATAPQPVTNRDFTRILGRVLQRPTPFRVPAAALRLVLGEMADSTLLASARAQPGYLLQSGYQFEHPELEAALRHVLGKH